MFSFARLFVQTNEKVNAVLMSFLGRPSAHRNYRVALDSPKSELSGKKIRQRDLFYQSRLIFLSDKENFSIRGLWFYFVLHVFSCHRHCVCIFSCHCHHFHTAKRGCIRKILYFCPWLSQSLGMGGSRHFGFRVSLTAERVSATSLVGKGRFLNVIFYHIELRNFDSIRRYRNEASTLGVLYPCAIGVSFRKGVSCGVHHL